MRECAETILQSRLDDDITSIAFYSGGLKILTIASHKLQLFAVCFDGLHPVAEVDLKEPLIGVITALKVFWALLSIRTKDILFQAEFDIYGDNVAFVTSDTLTIQQFGSSQTHSVSFDKKDKVGSVDQYYATKLNCGY